MTEGLQSIDLIAAVAAAVLRANLIFGLAVVAVLPLRAAATRWHGSAVAYRLWLAPFLLALLSPIAAFLGDGLDPLADALAARPAALEAALAVWVAGATALACAFALAQMRFQAELKAGRAGPAVIGFFAPRVIFPADSSGFTAAELELIRAHEREHVARKDPRAVAIAAVVQCLCWFNPLAHVAAALLRLDQELACDAAVVLRRPAARGLYARTLLKTQMAARAGPLACCWLALGVHPLELRLAAIKRRGRASTGGAVHAAADAIRP